MNNTWLDPGLIHSLPLAPIIRSGPREVALTVGRSGSSWWISMGWVRRGFGTEPIVSCWWEGFFQSMSCVELLVGTRGSSWEEIPRSGSGLRGEQSGRSRDYAMTKTDLSVFRYKRGFLRNGRYNTITPMASGLVRYLRWGVSTVWFCAFSSIAKVLSGS